MPHTTPLIAIKTPYWFFSIALPFASFLTSVDMSGLGKPAAWTLRGCLAGKWSLNYSFVQNTENGEIALVGKGRKERFWTQQGLPRKTALATN